MEAVELMKAQVRIAADWKEDLNLQEFYERRSAEVWKQVVCEGELMRTLWLYASVVREQDGKWERGQGFREGVTLKGWSVSECRSQSIVFKRNRLLCKVMSKTFYCEDASSSVKLATGSEGLVWIDGKNVEVRTMASSPRNVHACDRG